MPAPTSPKQGFTLVELLIVITLIALLAVAVLSAINPIEQFNKARDTARQADASQLLNAIERYYTNNEAFPWNWNGTTHDFTQVSNALPVTDARATNMHVCGNAGCTTNGRLIVQGELKDSFRNRRAFQAPGTRSPHDALWVLKAANSSDVEVCFRPSSASFRETRTLFAGTANNGPNAPLGACGANNANCYLCVPASGQR